MSANTNRSEFWATFLTVITIILAASLIAKFFKDLKRSSSDDIVSEEGKDILNDPEKRVILRNAIDQYHEKGNWDGLNELNPKLETENVG